MAGTKRFGELRRILLNVSQRTLTNQLRELESDGVIKRHVYAQVPPKVEYSLSERGQTLVPLLVSMKEWGEVYLDGKLLPPDCAPTPPQPIAL
jgi:DNA-binding HxlR family transcriptional regulator